MEVYNLIPDTEQDKDYKPVETLTDVFNKVVTHLLIQGKTSAEYGGNCRYRTFREDDTTLKCAVGCLISDSVYSEDLEDQIDYLTEGLEGIVALLIDDEVFGIELPSSVILAIVETAPFIKGATASGRTKTARLSTGVEVQVPEYLETDEVIKVNTETGKFMARA